MVESQHKQQAQGIEARNKRKQVHCPSLKCKVGAENDEIRQARVYIS